MFARVVVTGLAVLVLGGCASFDGNTMGKIESYTLDYDTPVDPGLQSSLEQIDAQLRAELGMKPEQTAVGVLDLKTLRLAMLWPDAIDYAASVPKIGILLAYFQMHPEAASRLDSQTRHELGLMIKVSDNEMAAKYSQQLGLKQIQQVLDSYGFYDATRGGGLWIGKHYNRSGERYGDPIADHSHAATVRQLLRYYLLLEQGKLVSPKASRTMREIFASPEIPHLNDKFVKGLEGRDAQLLRKSGWWENWFHDTAIVSGGGRHYIIVAMTHHARGEEYLVEFARRIDDVLTR
jgi:beta-lactamase class A